MPRRGSSTQRGYGTPHRRAARELKRELRDGDPCCRCGQPMWRWQLGTGRRGSAGIDADHRSQANVLGGLLPDGLAHRSCNRSAGASLGNRLRGGRQGGRARVHPGVGGGGTRAGARSAHSMIVGLDP